MAQYDDDAPPPGYRYVYFGDPTRGTSGRYPVPIETATAEPNRDVVGTSNAPSLPTAAPELQPEPSRDIAPHRYVAGEVPGGPAPEPTLDQMRYELAIKNLTSADWLMGAGENAASLLTSPIGMLGGYAGLGYHMLRGAPFEEANRRAADWAQASMYQPTTMAGQEIAEKINPTLASLPPVISGIMPGLMRPPRGTTGTLTAGVKRDVGQFSNDVFNAQRGITPGYPTMGSEFQKAFVEPRPNVYEMMAGLEPSNVPSTASAAIKTRGGNSPLSFGGDLKDSGQIGEHLNTLLSRVNPASVRQSAQINHVQPIAERWGNFLWNTKKLSDNEVSALTEPANANKYSQLLDEFALTHKEQFPQLKTLAELEKVEQAEKDFITGQYARYLTNDAGTGAKTDPFVRLAEQGIALPRIADKIAAMSPEELLKETDINALTRDVMSKTLERRGVEGKEAVKETATTPLGQYVEGLSDDILFPINKQSYQDLLTIHKELGLPSQYADSPTPFERVSDKAPIWDVKDGPASNVGSDLGLPYLLNKLKADLRSGAIAPENIKNVSLESLLHSVIKEHKEKLVAEAKELSSFETLYQRPGSKNVWKNITDEANDDKTAAMHKRVADKMAICIGNSDYCQRAIDQEAFHSILFGPNGEPHVAVESRPSSVSRAFALLSNADKELLNAETAKALGYTLSDALNAASPKRKRDFEDIRNELYTEFFGYPPEEIYQVKGKANSQTVDPRYIEDTRDFLNSREWLPSSGNSRDFNRNSVTIGGLVDTQYDDSLNAYAKRMRFSGYREVLGRFKAAELLGRKLPGRFATDKDITEFIKGPETLQYNHGSPISGLTSLGTDINRTRSADTGLWLAKSYKTAGTYAGMKGSIYGVEVQNKQLDVLDARNSPGGNIPLDSVIYHADGKQTRLSELAAHLGVTKLSTDDVARYAKNTGANGLHILNVGDVSGRANPFVNEAPDYADNLVIFNPRILKIIKEDKAPPFVPAGKAEGGIIHMADGGQPRPLSYVENKSESFAEYRRGIGMKKGTVNKFEGGAVTDTLDKMVKNPQASTLLNLDLPNVIAAKQQTKPLKRGGKVEFSNNMDDMRYALTRR